MDGEDLTPPPASTSTSDVLRKFDQDTTLVAKILLGLLIVAAAALGCEGLVQRECVRQTVAGTMRATDQETQLTSSMPAEASYRSVETPASPPLSSQSNPIDAQITASQRSFEPVEELVETKSKSPRHRRPSHASLSRTRQFWGFSDRHWQAND